MQWNSKCPANSSTSAWLHFTTVHITLQYSMWRARPMALCTWQDPGIPVTGRWQRGGLSVPSDTRPLLRGVLCPTQSSPIHKCPMCPSWNMCPISCQYVSLSPIYTIRVYSLNSCCGLSENLTNVCQLIWARQSLSLAKTSFNLKYNQIGSWSDTRPTHLNVPRSGEAQQQYLPLTSLSRSAINRGNLPCWCQLNHCWVLQVLQECHSVATLHTYSSNPTHLVNLPHFNQIQCLFLIFSSGGSKLWSGHVWKPSF